MSESRGWPLFVASFPAMLGLVAVVLKLCCVVGWSWVWVLAPLWVTVAVGVLAVLAMFAWSVRWRR